jgi:hypothetical protein
MPVRIKELAQLSSTPMPKALMAGFAVCLGLLIYGLLLLLRDQEAFLVWIREDGLVEWITFAVLLITSALSFVMSYDFGLSRPGRGAKRVWLFLGFLFLFGAMEEISWGQRVLGIESPDWFIRHNKQGETNLHNLIIYGVSVNKLIFGKILGILIGMYLLAAPLLYRINGSFRHFMNRWGIPVAQNYQIILCVIVIILVQIHLRLAGKVAELRELCIAYLFLLILVHPYNQEAFPLRELTLWRWMGLLGVGKARE